MNAKDTQRIEGIIAKSNGSISKAAKLAVTMANKIKDSSKAEGRYMAAYDKLGEIHPVTSVFKQRFMELTGQSVTNVTPLTLENDTTEDNTIYFPTASAITLWEWEFSGQISDGMWENSRPYDHWRSWCTMKSKLGNPRRSRRTNHPVTKASYNFGALKQYVGDRMLTYGKFGKAVGNDILNMGSEVRSIVEEFPTEPFNLEEFKSNMIKRNSWRNAEYYWKGLEQKHIDAYYNTNYTNTDLNNDIRTIKEAMKTII